MGRSCCGARRESGSEGREGFVYVFVFEFAGIVDVVAGAGAVGKGLLLRLFPVLSGATGVIPLSLSFPEKPFRGETSPKYDDDELSGRCCCCWLYLGCGGSGEVIDVTLSWSSSWLPFLVFLCDRGWSMGAVTNGVVALMVDGERVAKGDSGRRKGDVRGELKDKFEGL